MRDHFWNLLEVCACIQISKDKILVFGESDAKINTTLVFYVNEYSCDKKGELKRPQVFVTAPFLIFFGEGGMGENF